MARGHDTHARTHALFNGYVLYNTSSSICSVYSAFTGYNLLLYANRAPTPSIALGEKSHYALYSITNRRSTCCSVVELSSPSNLRLTRPLPSCPCTSAM